MSDGQDLQMCCVFVKKSIMKTLIQCTVKSIGVAFDNGQTFLQ